MAKKKDAYAEWKANSRLGQQYIGSKSSGAKASAATTDWMANSAISRLRSSSAPAAVAPKSAYESYADAYAGVQKAAYEQRVKEFQDAAAQARQGRLMQMPDYARRMGYYDAAGKTRSEGQRLYNEAMDKLRAAGATDKQARGIVHATGSKLKQTSIWEDIKATNPQLMSPDELNEYIADYEAQQKERERLLGMDLSKQDELIRRAQAEADAERRAVVPGVAAERNQINPRSAVRAAGSGDARDRLAELTAERNRAASLQKDEEMRAMVEANKAYYDIMDNRLSAPQDPEALGNYMREQERVLAEAGYGDPKLRRQLDDARRWVRDMEAYDRAYETARELATYHPRAASMLSVPANLAGGVTGMTDLAFQKLEGRDALNMKGQGMVPYAFTQGVRRTVSENLAKAYDTEILGENLAVFMYNTSMSMADSAVIAGLAALGFPPNIGTALLGASAAVDTAVQAKAMGASDNQALAYATMAGVAEYFFEKVQIESLLKMKPAAGTVRQRVMTTLRNMARQGLTEASEEVLTDIANAISDAVVNGDLSEYNRSVREYKAQGMSDDEARAAARADFVRQLTLSGIGGMLSGFAFGIPGSVRRGVTSGVELSQRNETASEMFGDSGAELVQEALEINPDNKVAQQAKKRLDKGKALSGDTLRTLVEGNEAAMQTQSDTGVSREALKNEIVENGTATDGAIRYDVRLDAKTGSFRGTITADPTAVSGMSRSRALGLTAAGMRSDVLYETTGATPEAVASDMLAQTDPRRAGSSAAVRADTAADVQRLAEYAGDFGAAANVFINAKPDGMDVDTYRAAFNVAYQYGAAGARIDQAMKAVNGVGLPGEAVTAAYYAGKGHLDYVAQQQRSALNRRASGVRRGPGRVALVGVTEGEMSARQRDSLRALRYIAKFSGINVNVVSSRTDAEGRYIDPNGEYDPATNTITVDINAGRTSADSIEQSVMLKTMSHELTHFIQANNPEAYAQLKSFVSEHLLEKGVSLESLKAQKIAAAADAGVTLDDDGAMDEVVADACENMLQNTTAIDTLAEQNWSLFKSIRKWLREFHNALKRAFSGGYVHPEAQAMLDYADGLQKLWDAAFVKAVDTYQQTADTDMLELISDGGQTVGVTDKNNNAVLSIRTYEDGGRRALEDFLGKQTKGGNITNAEADDMLRQMDEMYNLAKDYAGKYTDFGAWSYADVATDPRTGKPVFSVVKANGDYSMNLDFSLVCKKRRTLDAVFQQMIADGVMDDFQMVESSIAYINDIIRRAGFETACSLCFVDSKRYRVAMVADAFVGMYNDLVRSMIRPGQHADAFNYGGNLLIRNDGIGIDTLPDADLDFTRIDEVLKTAEKGTVEYKIASDLKAHPEDRKLLMRGDFMSAESFDTVKRKNPRVMSLYNAKKGAGGPKASSLDVQYLNEIIRPRTFNVKKAYAVGGVRIQSFSDYVPRLVFDYVQMIADLSAKQLPAHAYTKEPLFILQYGLTGIKSNMSLVPEVVDGGIAPGLDAKGNYAWRDGQSFGSTVYDGSPAYLRKCFEIIGKKYTGQKRLTAAEGFELAKAIQNAEGYGQNCGTIAVGVSDAHIFKLLRDDDIRMVIPYHKSSLNHIVAAMENIDKFTDYTGVQNTRRWNGKEWVRLEKGEKDFNYNEALQRLGDAKAASNEYLAWCAKNGYKPKFDTFMQEENYYKLLEDFSCYDMNGNATPQGGVKLTLPTESSAFGSMRDLIEMGLEEDALLQGKQDAAVPQIVEEIKKTLPAFEAQQRGERTFADATQEGRDRVAIGNDEIKLSARDNATFEKYARKINDVVEEAINNSGDLGVANNTEKIMPVPAVAAAMVKQASGGKLDISHKYYGLNGDYLWHEYREHGGGEANTNEANNGQVAFTKRTFKNAIKAFFSPEIVEVLYADGNNKNQRASFAYAKRSANGRYIVVEAVGGRKNPTIVPVMILQLSAKRWNEAQKAGKSLAEILYGHDPKTISAMDIVNNKKNRVTAAQIARLQSAYSPLSPRSSDVSVADDSSVVKQKSVRDYSQQEKQDHIRTAAQHFGTTKNWNEAGYLTADGQVLDFSGRHDGAPGGYRTVDHRDIKEALGLDYGGDGYSDAMIQFMSEGNIRLMPETGGINLQMEPTDRQYAELRRYITWALRHDGVALDFDDQSGNTVRSEWYEPSSSISGNVSRSGEIIDVIREHYAASGRQVSDLARFHRDYSLRASTNISGRDLLASATDAVAQTPAEADALHAYQRRAAELRKARENLAEQNALLRSGTLKGDDRLKAQNRARVYSGQVNRLNAELSRLDDTATIRTMREREESLVQNYLWNEARGGTRQDLRDTNRLIGQMEQGARDAEELRRTKERMQGRIDELTQERDELRERLRTDVENATLAGQMAQGARDAEILRRYNDRMRKRIEAARESMANYKARRADTESRSKLRKRIGKSVKRLDAMLRNPTDQRHIPDGLQGAVLELLDVFTNDTSVFSREKLARVTAEYQKLEKTDINLAGEYDADIPDMLDSLAETISGKRLSELTADELRTVKDVVDHFTFMVKNENAIFVAGRRQSLEEAAVSVISRSREQGVKSSVDLGKVDAFARMLSTGNIKPEYFFRDVGGELQTLWNDMLAGQSRYAFNLQDAKEAKERIQKDTGYKEWWNDKTTYSATTEAGQDITLTIGQALSLLATYQRELATGNTFHVTKGGFLYAEDVRQRGKLGIKYKVENREAHPMSVTDMEDVIEWLRGVDPRTLDYVAQMVQYLSEDMAALGNETSMELYGYKKFGEEYYYPIKSADEFLKQEPGQAGYDQSRWKHKGFTKATLRGANNPFVLSDFDEIWGQHVSQMCMYNGMAIAQDNMVRLLNYKTSVSDNGPSHSVKSEFITGYGRNAYQYIDTLLSDINGGIMIDPREGAINSMISLFKKNAVFASMSVAIQQPSSIARAMAVMNPKYLIMTAGSKRNYTELKKYSGVAIIKEIGGFDTNTGRSGADWLMTGRKSNALDIYNTAATWLPQKMDEVTWAHIWNAVKAEIAETSDLKVGSEEYYRRCGKRFDEIIELTQVYDSVLTRSENMRSKSGMVKTATAFMAEPTTTLNMVVDALQNAKENPAQLTRTLTAVLCSILLNNVLKAAVTAGRDKDEDQTWLEKYVAKVVGGIKDDFRPMSYIPLLNDLQSVIDGYTVEASYASVISDAYKTIKKAFDEPTADSVIDALASVSGVLGVPTKNIVRDVRGVINTWVNSMPLDETSRRGLLKAVQEGLDYSGKLDDDIKRVYKANAKGDAAGRQKYLDEVNAEYDDKVRSLMAKGASREEAEKKARSAVMGRVTAYLKPLYQNASTNSEKAAIKSLALRFYVGRRQLYADYNWKQWDK